MSKEIKISIPSPCHENWAAMTPVEKGRFCGSCQKVVHDFTRSSDREIAEIFKKETNLCGRFRDFQLERTLVLPQKNKPIWLAAGAAVMSFLVFGTTQANAQEKPTTEQGEIKKTTSKQKVKPFSFEVVTGTVLDVHGRTVGGATITNSESPVATTTNTLGKFAIAVKTGQGLIITHDGYQELIVTVDEIEDLTITLTHKPEEVLYTLGGAVMGLKIEPYHSFNELPERATRSIWDLFN